MINFSIVQNIVFLFHRLLFFNFILSTVATSIYLYLLFTFDYILFCFVWLCFCFVLFLTFGQHPAVFRVGITLSLHSGITTGKLGAQEDMGCNAGD